MSWWEKTAWYIYLLIFSAFIWERCNLFFHPDSAISLYYRMLYSFDSSYYLPYALNLIHIITNFLLIIPVVLFINGHKEKHLLFWKLFFCFKLAIDLFGQNYEFKHVVSYYKMDVWIGFLALIFYLAIFIPAYIGLGLYAFLENEESA